MVWLGHRGESPVGDGALSRTFVVLGAALVVGCVGDPPREVAPPIDPSLPKVDAPWDPVPAPPRADAGVEEGSSSGGAATSSSGGSSGAVTDRDAGEARPPPGDSQRARQGEILITEVMYDPSVSEPTSEWFELYNTAASMRTLTGLTIIDGAGRTHDIGAGVAIAPRAYVVFVRQKSAALAANVPASAIVYEYGAGLHDAEGIQLSNGASGSLLLRDGTVTVAQADYGGWFADAAGHSVQLKVLSFAASAESGGWCLSQNAWIAGSDKGTPGVASDCP